MIKEMALRATTQASYYGKAVVITDTVSGIVQLKSYSTIVCEVDADGNFRRLWGGFSATTLRHVNDFRVLFGLRVLSKREWCALPCDNTERWRVERTNVFAGRTDLLPQVFDDEEDAWDFAEALLQDDGYSGRIVVNVVSAG